MNKNLFVLLGLLCLSSFVFSQEDIPVEDGGWTEGILVEDPGSDINYDYDYEWDFEGTEGIVIEFGEGDINYGDNEDFEFELDFESGDEFAYVDIAEPTIAIDEFINQDEEQNDGFLAR